MPSTVELGNETWFAYDCMSGQHADTSGVSLDVRLWRDSPPPQPIPCPECGVPMDYRGRWKADDSGYGSRADLLPEEDLCRMASQETPRADLLVDALRLAYAVKAERVEWRAISRLLDLCQWKRFRLFAERARLLEKIRTARDRITALASPHSNEPLDPGMEGVRIQARYALEALEEEPSEGEALEEDNGR